MLRLEAAGYRYAGAQAEAIRGIDLTLGDGEVVGLAGASESGKTTVCLVVAGLAPRTLRGTLTGSFTLDGEDIGTWPMHQVAGVIGTLFQDPATQVSGVCGTVFEEVAFTPMNLGLPRDEVIAPDVVCARPRCASPTWPPAIPSRLSGGQMQLVAMAGLLAMRPRHLVLDEPTAQLDPAGTRLVGEAVERLARRRDLDPHRGAEDRPPGAHLLPGGRARVGTHRARRSEPRTCSRMPASMSSACRSPPSPAATSARGRRPAGRGGAAGRRRDRPCRRGPGPRLPGRRCARP